MVIELLFISKTESPMFFEQIGRSLFARIRFPFFLLLLAVPPICSSFYLFSELQSLRDLHERASTAMTKVKGAFTRKARKEKILERHSHPDPYFLDKEIESFSFLSIEQHQLREWLSHPAIANKQPLLDRLRFLEKGDNHLSFMEEEFQISPLCKETIEKQRNWIELDNDDLKRLLTMLEINPKEKSPQLLVTEFLMHKKETPLHSEAFEIKMNLLKREFLSP